MENMSSVPHVNSFLSLTAEGTNFVRVSLYGRIKILKCFPSVLKEVLNMVDGERSFADIIKRLSRKYPVEDIHSFLITLIQAEVIVSKSGAIEADHIADYRERLAIPAESGGNHSVALIGRGKLVDAVREILHDELDASKYRNIALSEIFLKASTNGGHEEAIHSALELLKDFKQSFLIICPDKCTYGSLVALNDACLKLHIPFLLCYFNGRDILLGPTVIPGKTPCYGCLIEHRRCYMREKSKVAELTFEDLLSIGESWPLKLKPFLQSVVNWVGAYAVAEARTFRQAGLSPGLIKKQLRVPPAQITDHFSAVTFETITTCPSCFGMNRGRVCFGCPDQSHPLAGNKIVLKEMPIVYQQGGRRSVTGEMAKKMIAQTLDRIGLKVKFEKLTGGALDNILFRYTATIESEYNSQVPFLIPKHLSQRGKGITEEQAYLSAAFELFERVSSRYYGNVEMVRATYKEVKDIAINIESYIGQTFYNEVMNRFEKDTPIDWVWGYSLVNHCPKLVPASMVYWTAGKFLGHFSDSLSGGLSAGSTIEDAILQALLEIVEHDAWMIWQANAITLPQIKLDTIRVPHLTQILDRIQACGFRIIIRNYTTDISIPVFKTWIVNDKDYSHYATSGFGANLNPDLALERSISEACQSMDSDREEEQLSYRGPVSRNMVFSYYSLYSLYHFNQLEISNNGQALDYCQFSTQATSSVTGDIKKIISLLHKPIQDVDVIVVDLTKELLTIPAVRVILGGGIQRIAEPILSTSRRLFELPQKLGYRKEKLTYKELYLGPYPH